MSLGRFVLSSIIPKQPSCSRWPRTQRPSSFRDVRGYPFFSIMAIFADTRTRNAQNGEGTQRPNVAQVFSDSTKCASPCITTSDNRTRHVRRRMRPVLIANLNQRKAKEMSKSVRHVHARPGQHIVVHRHHWRRPRPRPQVVYSYTTRGSGCMVPIVIGIALVLCGCAAI